MGANLRLVFILNSYGGHSERSEESQKLSACQGDSSLRCAPFRMTRNYFSLQNIGLILLNSAHGGGAGPFPAIQPGQGFMNTVVSGRDFA
jgi:hypothetical protein